MVPKDSVFNQSVAASGMCARKAWRFPCSHAVASDGEVIQKHHFYHHGDTICHPKSGYVTTKLYGTSTYVGATIMRSFQTELFSCFLPSSYAGHVNLTASKCWRFMPKCKHGSIVKFIIFRVQDFLSAYVPCQMLWLYCKVVQWDIM